MPTFKRLLAKPSHSAIRPRHLFIVAFLLTFFSGTAAIAQVAAKAPAKLKSEPPAIKEELIFKNGDRLTGTLSNSTGEAIKFKSDLAGEVTVLWANVKELKSSRDFAVIPKDIKDSRNSAAVPQGAIKIGEKSIAITPITTATSTSDKSSGKQPEQEIAPAKVVSPVVIPTSKVGFVVDDDSYLKEIHRKIDRTSGWDGHLATGSTAILSTQNSFTLTVAGALKRSVPTVSWLNPKLRTMFDFNLSVGKTTQPGDPDTFTNVFHVGAERDEYFSPRGYYLQVTSFDHDYSQGLTLQQIYGGGVGATLVKSVKRELDITADLHYEGQQFNSTSNEPELDRHLIGSSLAETYSRKWGEVHFDEKLSANLAWNDESAFSATGTSSVRMPVYKKLAFSLSVIDNFLNSPQIGYKKNSLQVSTGFAFTLH
jgi:Protein of unknown function, DUF481